MVYSSPDSNYQFYDLANSQSIDRNVRIVYNGKYIHLVTSGNVPLLSIKENSNTNENGELYSSTVNLTLNGKILPNNQGTTGILKIYNNLIDLFYGTGQMSGSYNGILSVQCGATDTTDGIFSATGVRVKNINLDPSTDNWVQGADYSIDLEYTIGRGANTGFYVKNTVDSWTIEPLEDYVYYSYSGLKISDAKLEKHNPLLKPTAATSAAPQPSAPPTNISLYTIPQYKISRRVSAVGFPSTTGLSGTFTAYKEAQKWVLDRLNLTYLSTGTRAMHVSLTDSEPYLYNHMRTINFSVHDGSYEANESWLAMPTGMAYTEEYSVETSSDESYNKIVKIQGNIKGLVRANSGLMSGVTGILPTGSTVDLNQILTPTPEYETISYSIPDADPVATSNVSYISKAKYNNALNGWINDIKPYLYRRANIVMHSYDRKKVHINNTTTPPSSPENPVFCYEKPLNINPILFSETHDPRKGIINYTCEFNNKFKYFPETVAESITISDDNPIDVVNEAFVLGRRLGPVLQGLGTITSAKKTVNLEVMVVPPTSIKGFFMCHGDCPLYVGGTLYSGIDLLLNQLKPFGDRPTSVFGSYGTRTPTESDQGDIYVASDTHAWDPTEGSYKRTIQWVYQHCSTSTDQMDY